MAKFALVINGDKEQHHLNNVEQSLAVFEREGYETFVVSPERPETGPDHYIPPTLVGIAAFVGELKTKIRAGDELVIYTTGRGEENNGNGSLCLPTVGCDFDTIAPLLDSITLHRRRVVIMDQNYSGNWAKLFADDPRTLFIALGDGNESDSCQEIMSRFWSPAGIPDSWQERFDHAVAGVSSFRPQIITGRDYPPEGKPPFESKVLEIPTPEEMDAALGRLTPSQYAVINFSAASCKSCEQYKPLFEKMAVDDGGRHLWLFTEDKDLAKEWGIHGFPSVVVVNSRGERLVVINTEHVPDAIALFESPLKEYLLKQLKDVEKMEDSKRSDALQRFISVLDSGLARLTEEEFDEIFRKSTPVIGGIKYPYARSGTFRKFASVLSRAGLRDRAVRAFEESEDAAAKIEKPYDRSMAFLGIAYAMAEAGLEDKAVEAIEKSIHAAEEIEKTEDCSLAFRKITGAVAWMGSQMHWEEDVVIKAFGTLIFAANGTNGREPRPFLFREIASALTKDRLNAVAIKQLISVASLIASGEEPHLGMLILIALDMRKFHYEICSRVFGGIAFALAEASQKDKNSKVFEQFVSIVEQLKVKDQEVCSLTFRNIAFALAENDEALKQFISATEKNGDSEALIEIASGLAKAGQKDKAAEVFLKSIAVAEILFRYHISNEAFILVKIGSTAAKAGLGKDRAAGVFERLVTVAEKAGINPAIYIVPHMKAAGLDDQAAEVIRKSSATTAAAKAKMRDLKAETFRRKIADAEKIKDPENRFRTFMGIAHDLTEAGLDEIAGGEFLGQLILAAMGIGDSSTRFPALAEIFSALVEERIGDPKVRPAALREVSSVLIGEQLEGRATGVPDMLISAVEKTKNPYICSQAFLGIASAAARTGLQFEALEAFPKAIAAAERIENGDIRSSVLNEIDSAMATARVSEQEIRRIKGTSLPSAISWLTPLPSFRTFANALLIQTGVTKLGDINPSNFRFNDAVLQYIRANNLGGRWESKISGDRGDATPNQVVFNMWFSFSGSAKFRTVEDLIIVVEELENWLRDVERAAADSISYCPPPCTVKILDLTGGTRGQ